MAENKSTRPDDPVVAVSREDLETVLEHLELGDPNVITPNLLEALRRLRATIAAE